MTSQKINVDLRSDTVTRPTPEMLEAMMTSPVGDDVFGEDPTVLELEAYAAKLFGKEAALFCVSGTQTNQIGLAVHLSPGGEVICHEESHIYKYEGGGIARNSGASVRLIGGNRGRMTASEISHWFNNPLDVHLPLTQLISLEDTANRGGGAIYDFAEIERIAALAKSWNIPLHLDGARVMNALVETQIDTVKYGSPFDSISLCLSKGLGAPIGSVLIGSKSFIQHARRIRKVFGGGMRQAGILAGAGLYALKNNVNRLLEDHRHARLIGDALTLKSWVKEVYPVETNIVVACLHDAHRRDEFIGKLAENGVKVVAFGPAMIRFVTHLDITESMVQYTIEQIQKLD